MVVCLPDDGTTAVFEGGVRIDAKPGDVCNDYGDIRIDGLAPARMACGRVWVTKEQAENAAPFGWKLAPQTAWTAILRSNDLGLVVIER